MGNAPFFMTNTKFLKGNNPFQNRKNASIFKFFGGSAVYYASNLL